MAQSTLTIVASEIVVARGLEELEGIIERGITTFVEVGQALMEIRDSRLYREQGYATFEDYCRTRWGWGRNYVNKQIQAAKVAEALGTIVPNLPATESQARELAPLLHRDEAQVVEVWRELKQEYGDEITAERIRAAVLPRLQDISLAPAPGSLQNPPAHVSYNSGNNEWYTPSEYIEAARRVMGEIDLDPASSEQANQVVKAAHFYTVDTDGLQHAWQGRLWMNPPYASDLIGKFTDKLACHIEAGDVSEAICLVNNATETSWFARLINVASAVVFPRGRVRFWQPEGGPGAPLQGQAVIYCGPRPNDFLAAFQGFGWGAQLG